MQQHRALPNCRPRAAPTPQRALLQRAAERWRLRRPSSQAGAGDAEQQQQQQPQQQGQQQAPLQQPQQPPPPPPQQQQQQQQPAAPPPSDGSAGPDPRVAAARQELHEAWDVLKDAAGTVFVPGYESAAARAAAQAGSGAGPEADAGSPFLSYSGLMLQAAAANEPQLQSLPARLKRLLSGEFLRERASQSSSSSSTTRPPLDARLAALQFELLKGLQDQPPPLRQPADGSLGAEQAAGAVQNAPEQQQPSQQGSSAAAAAAPQPGAAAASAAATAAAELGGQAGAASTEFYPAATRLLVAFTWLVWLLQWAPALPELWLTVTHGGPLHAAFALLLMFPDGPVTRALVLDAPALLQYTGWSGLLTAGLTHSGLACTWLCCSALSSAGAWLEQGTGQLRLLAVFLVSTLFACAAHMLGGSCATCVAGPGACMGVYTAWTLTAAEHLAGEVPVKLLVLQGAGLMLLLLVLGLVQPAIGVASVLGGAVGGVAATRLAAPLAVLLRWGLTLPVLGALLAVRLALEGLQLALLAVMFVVAAVWALGKGAVQGVRQL